MQRLTDIAPSCVQKSSAVMFFVFTGGPELLPFDAAKIAQFARTLAASLALDKPYPASAIQVTVVSVTPKAKLAHVGNSTAIVKAHKNVSAAAGTD